MTLCHVFHHSDYQTNYEHAERRIISMVDFYLDQHEFAQAFKFVVPVLKQDLIQPRLRSLIELAKDDHLFKSKAQAELAESLTGRVHTWERHELRAAAREVLEKEHNYRAYDIDIDQALEDLSPNSKLVRTIFNNHLDKYNQLSYPNGTKKWLYRFLDTASACHDIDLQHHLLKQIRELSEKTGMTLLSIHEHASHAARFYQTGGNTDLVRNVLEELSQDSRIHDLPYSRGHAAAILSEIYSNRENNGDIESALKWAKVCLNSWTRCPPETTSIGQLYFMNANITSLRVSRAADFSQIRASCDQYVAEDLKHGLVGNAVQKLYTLKDMFSTCQTIGMPVKIEEIQNLLKQVEEILQSSDPNKVTPKMWAELLQSQANFFMVLAGGYNGLWCEVEAVNALDQALLLLRPAEGTTMSYQYLTIQHQIGLVLFCSCTRLDQLLQYGQLAPSVLSLQHHRRELLHKAREIFHTCRDGYEVLSVSSQVGEANYWIAMTDYELWQYRLEAAQEALLSFHQVEIYFDAQRNEICISSGIEAIRTKQGLVKGKHFRDIYRLSIQMAISISDSSCLWNWIQKAKARSLSDTLGLGCLIPAAVVDSIFNSSDAKNLYLKEQKLMQKVPDITQHDRLMTTIELRSIRTRMEAFPSLRQLIDLRTGRSVTHEGLDKRWTDLQLPCTSEKVAFIDWYVKNEVEIYITILKCGNVPIHRKVDATTADVRRWIKQYIQTGEKKGPFFDRLVELPLHPMRKMDSLIADVAEHTEPDTTLVLCPSSPLEMIPLHALNISIRREGKPVTIKPLIFRNPIIYCANFTSFIQCCENSMRNHDKIDAPASFTAVYEGTTILEQAERTRVYASLETLSNRYGTKAMTGSSVTPDSIRSSWQNSRSIFFHGHCETEPTDITKQALVLAAQGENRDQPVFTSFAVTDVFKMKLKAPLVTLMACASSVQQVGPADEPLGLVTSLLCAGAASVIGTLWRIRSGTARAFTRIFYDEVTRPEHVLKVPDNPGLPTMIDLATAIQRTVQRLKAEPGMGTPYNWAGFVLQGSQFLHASAFTGRKAYQDSAN